MRIKTYSGGSSALHNQWKNCHKATTGSRAFHELKSATVDATMCAHADNSELQSAPLSTRMRQDTASAAYMRTENIMETACCRWNGQHHLPSLSLTQPLPHGRPTVNPYLRSPPNGDRSLLSRRRGHVLYALTAASVVRTARCLGGVLERRVGVEVADADPTLYRSFSQAAYKLECQKFTALAILILFGAGDFAAAHTGPISSVLPVSHSASNDGGAKPQRLVEPAPIILDYHNGPLLTQRGSIPVYILWYGSFSRAQRAILTDFFASFGSPLPKPSVSSWWKITSGYTASGAPVAPSVKVVKQLSDSKYSMGKALTNADLETLAVKSLAVFPPNPNAIIFIFTAADVDVESFCMNSCASHFATDASTATGNKQLPYVWVGNPGAKCPGLCAWPYAKPTYGPQVPPLVAPNGDVGVEGMVINTATMLAGTATNPFDTGYFQGDAGYPYEAATACQGAYGPNAYPGYPGDLLVDSATGASYNAVGVNKRKFLLPALWDPKTTKCASP
ncbi:hypothetical protein R1sor_023269 [Riccia sorocarpa]|uniref:Uncharacterized protein n=1 Tax=Riccia sorocarpa TaxID=122646 RepID=A0ABD3GM60_9MARC